MLKQFFKKIIIKIKVFCTNFVNKKLGLIIFKKKNLNSFLLLNEINYRSLLKEQIYANSYEYKQLQHLIN